MTYQNSPSCCVLEANSSLSLSLNAFHSQLRSDHGPTQTPPHSPPAHGLLNLTRFVSWPILLWGASDETVLTLANPVTQYGCSGNNPDLLRLLSFS